MSIRPYESGKEENEKEIKNYQFGVEIEKRDISEIIGLIIEYKNISESDLIKIIIDRGQ